MFLPLNLIIAKFNLILPKANNTKLELLNANLVGTLSICKIETTHAGVKSSIEVVKD